jgi:hypothetical protein
MTSPSSAAAFEALAVVVRDRGIDIAEDPARLRGMLNDVLATDARVNRSAVDALVLAAELGVPRDLSTTPVADVPRLAGQLASRGVAPDLADQTVRAWVAAAQGGRTAPSPMPPVAPQAPLAPTAATVLPSTVLPGALPPPPPAPSPLAPPPPGPPGETAMPPSAEMRDGTVPTTSPSADEADVATGATPAITHVVVPPPPPGPPSSGDDGGGSGMPRRMIVVLVAAIVAVVAIAAGALALGGGGDGDDASSPTTAPPTTTPVTSTPATGDVLLEVLTPASGTEAATRDVEMTGRTAPGATVTVNGTAAAVDATGNWKLTVSLPDPETKFSVVAKTSAGGTKTVDWVVKRDSVAPALEIVDPPDGAVLPVRTFALRGTTELNTAVAVDGLGAGPDASLSTDTILGWTREVTIIGDQQTFTVTSTDQAGNVTTKAVTLRFAPSAPPLPPRPPTIPQPPTGGPGPGPTAPPTTPAPTPPAIVAVNDDAATWNFQAGGIISFNVVGNDSGEWTDIEWSGLSGGYGTLSYISNGFFQYTMRDAGNWTETFQYRLRNSATGAVSNWATVTFRIVCSC